jgi:hypothetical protein
MFFTASKLQYQQEESLLIVNIEDCKNIYEFACSFMYRHLMECHLPEREKQCDDVLKETHHHFQLSCKLKDVRKSLIRIAWPSDNKFGSTEYNCINFYV